jgi:hypothetical protein
MLANTCSCSVSGKGTRRPRVDNDRFCPIVPTALRVLVGNWGCSWGHRSGTRSLECPPHGSIGRFRREVFTRITIGTLGPSLALVDNRTRRVSGNKDRDTVTLFIFRSLAVDTWASASDFNKLRKRRSFARSNSPIAVANKGPPKFCRVAGFILGAVSGEVYVRRTFPDEGVCSIKVG